MVEYKNDSSRYYAENREAILAKKRRIYLSSPEDIKKRSKEYYELNKEKILADRRERRAAMKIIHAVTAVIDGREITMFTIGELARRLGRDVQTVRGWERRGVIPVARYRSLTNQRLYTEEQISAIVRIAQEEKILICRDFMDTNFTQRVIDAFEEFDKRGG